jgi:hypothetical protein
VPARPNSGNPAHPNQSFGPLEDSVSEGACLERELIPLVIAYLERQNEDDRTRLNEWMAENAQGNGWLLTRPGQGLFDRWFGCFGVLHLLPNDLADELACDFAEHILPLWESHRPNDPRPRIAVATRRRWIRGEATLEEWRCAWSAAGQATEECRAATWTTEEEVSSKRFGGGIVWACCGGCLLTRGVDAAFITAWAACEAARSAGWQARPDLTQKDRFNWQDEVRQREAEWQRLRLIDRLRVLHRSRE